MSWGEWMVVNMSMEEQLSLETQARAALHHHDPAAVGRLCSALIKQNAMQAQLIRQATGHIAKLEMEQFLSESQASAAPLRTADGSVRG